MWAGSGGSVNLRRMSDHTFNLNDFTKRRTQSAHRQLSLCVNAMYASKIALISTAIPILAAPNRLIQGNRKRMVKAAEAMEATTLVEDESLSSSATVAPAVLPDTPKDFPLGEDKLIELSKAAFATGTGVKDDSVLAEDFRFEFPVVSLDRAAYLKAVRSFNLEGAIPDLNANPYHWRVDPYEPNRVWFTLRTTGKHTGDLKFGSSTYKATGKIVQGAPECASYVFDEHGKIKSFTGGYVMDRRVGNTKGLGAMFGILAAIGAPVPSANSLMFAIAVTVNRFMTWLKGLFSFGGNKEE